MNQDWFHRTCQNLLGEHDLGGRARNFTDVDLGSIADRGARGRLELVAQCVATGRPVHALLPGPTGVGKTHALLAVARAVLAAGITPDQLVLGTEQDIVAPRPPAREGERWETIDLDQLFRGRRLLLLDELGRGRYPQWDPAANRHLQLLQALKRHRVSALFATNFRTVRPDPARPGMSLYENVDPAVASRLTEMCGAMGDVMVHEDHHGTAVDHRLISS